MKKLLVVLDDELSKELDKYPNKSQVVREALKIYNGHISTDTVAGLRQSYKSLQDNINSRFDYYDECFARMDQLISVLETRM
jgi:Arc/MetJ-type ribon-helix-helix transcriptional regulator